jgi:hypothetical protein
MLVLQLWKIDIYFNFEKMMSIAFYWIVGGIETIRGVYLPLSTFLVLLNREM